MGLTYKSPAVVQIYKIIETDVGIATNCIEQNNSLGELISALIEIKCLKYVIKFMTYESVNALWQQGVKSPTLTPVKKNNPP